MQIFTNLILKHFLPIYAYYTQLFMSLYSTNKKTHHKYLLILSDLFYKFTNG